MQQKNALSHEDLKFCSVMPIHSKDTTNTDPDPNGSLFYLLSFYGWHISDDWQDNMNVSNPFVWDRPIKLPLSGLIDVYGNKKQIGEEGFFHVSGFGFEEYHINVSEAGSVVPAD